jgi:hypothetical protein
MFDTSKLRLLKSGLPILLALLFVGACGDDPDNTDTGIDCQNNCEGGDAGQSGDTGDSADSGDDASTDDASTDDASGDASGDADDQAPTVLSNAPLDQAIDVRTDTRISVTFSKAMDTATLDTSTFTLTTGNPAVAVDGRVTTHPGARVVFWADAPLELDTEYTATVTTGAESASSVALEMDHSWTFTTADTAPPMMPVNLGTAGDFVVLAKAAISTASASTVTGDMGISPAAATYITEFSLIADATNVFSTSSQVTGKIYASNYTAPTPSNLTTAVGDMEIAFEDAASRPADYTEEAAGAIGGMTLDAGTYKWGTDVSISDDLTLDGSATDVWIFQVAGDLSIASAKRVNLTGGAVAKNVFWQVSGKAEFGTTSHFEGVVLCQTGITLKTGASINGRLLAQTAVNLDASVVVEPAQ